MTYIAPATKILRYPETLALVCERQAHEEFI